MQNLFVLLFFVSFISLLIGLASPETFSKIFRNKEITRKFILKIFGTSTIVLFFSIGIFAGPAQSEITNLPEQKNNKEIANVQSDATSISEIDQEQQINTSSNGKTLQNITNNKPSVITIKNAEEIPVESTVVQAKIETTKENTIYYSVTSVVDGDTIKINMNDEVVTLRLIGLDTPETVDPRKPIQCFGKEASNKAKELLIGKKIRIEKDITQGELDKYDRILAYVYREDGLFYNKYMIEQGYAHEYTYNTPYKYQAEFKEAQKLAKDNLRGLWALNTCNGDTYQSAIVVTNTVSNQISNTTDNLTGKYYTSSWSTSKYYYPESCDGWKSLDEKYLKSFDSLDLLLAAYPSRILNPHCQ